MRGQWYLICCAPERNASSYAVPFYEHVGVCRLLEAAMVFVFMCVRMCMRV